MNAAVLHTFGHAPKFESFNDPVPTHSNEVVITMKAASVKNLDRLRASGTHYASYKELPVVVGMDGVGILSDGRRVYAQGVGGTIAEKAVISSERWCLIPDGVDDALAATLPNAVVGSALALRFRAALQRGESVLINGATGVTGQLAVQLAREYGASRIIATGRNENILAQLKSMGADDVISLHDDDAVIVARLKKLHDELPFDVVVDYLWGKPIENIIVSLKSSGMNSFTHRVRIVTVGSMAGESISLSSAALRSSAFEILGSGFGSLSRLELESYNREILPHMMLLAAEGKITLQYETFPLQEVEQAWNHSIEPGKRLVITM